MTDYKQKVKDKETENDELIKRMDADRDLVNLDKYKMMDIVGTQELPGIINITLSDPALFAAHVESRLGKSIEQVAVETESKDFDTLYVEDVLRAAFDSADFRLRRQGRWQLDPFIDQMMCRRGGAGARCLFRMKDEVLIPDIVSWDRRFMTYATGEEGLDWAAYKTIRQKDVIEAEYGEDLKKYRVALTGKNAEVLDVWDTEHNEVWVKNEKIFEQEHKYGYTPVVVQTVTLGSMLADKENAKYEGESIFFLIRDLIPEMNRLASQAQTINQRVVKGALQEQVKDGRGTSNTREHDKVTADGAISLVDMGGGFAPMPIQDVLRSFIQMHSILETRIQRGSVTNFDLGTFKQPMSAVALLLIGEGKDEVYLPRLSARGFLKEQLSDMLIAQLIQIGGSFELGTRGHKRTFDSGKLAGDYGVTFKYFIKSPELEAGRFSMAAAAGNDLSDKYKRERIYQLDDPEGEEEQLRWEEAERLSPSIKMRRTMKALKAMDEDVEAALMGAEVNVNVDRLLAGDVTQLPKPEKKDEPTQVTSLLGNAGAGAPQPETEEEE